MYEILLFPTYFHSVRHTYELYFLYSIMEKYICRCHGTSLLSALCLLFLFLKKNITSSVTRIRFCPYLFPRLALLHFGSSHFVTSIAFPFEKRITGNKQRESSFVSHGIMCICRFHMFLHSLALFIASSLFVSFSLSLFLSDPALLSYLSLTLSLPLSFSISLTLLFFLFHAPFGFSSFAFLHMFTYPVEISYLVCNNFFAQAFYRNALNTTRREAEANITKNITCPEHVYNNKKERNKHKLNTIAPELSTDTKLICKGKTTNQFNESPHR